MRCFLVCFGSSKEEKRRNQWKHKVIPRDQRYGSPKSLQHSTPAQKVSSAEPLYPNTDLPVEAEEEFSLIAKKNVTSDTNLSDRVEEEFSLITKKKVTFDTNVKTYEPVALNESTELLLSKTTKEAQEESGQFTEVELIIQLAFGRRFNHIKCWVLPP